MKLLVIVPAYNEEGSLEHTIKELKAELARVRAKGSHRIDYLVVNDGSVDSTRAICIEKGYPLLDLAVNCGLTAAFGAGMKYAARAGYDAAVQFDADGQHDPSYLEHMVDVMEQEGLDIVIGSRFVSAPKGGGMRMVGSRFLSALIKMRSHTRITDPTSGLRMYSTKIISKFSHDASLSPEPDMLVRMIHQGARVQEIQVTMRERQAGSSYLTPSRAVKYMLGATIAILLA